MDDIILLATWCRGHFYGDTAAVQVRRAGLRWIAISGWIARRRRCTPRLFITRRAGWAICMQSRSAKTDSCQSCAAVFQLRTAEPTSARQHTAKPAFANWGGYLLCQRPSGWGSKRRDYTLSTLHVHPPGGWSGSQVTWC